MDILIWALVIAGVIGTIVLGRLFKIKDAEANMAILILELIDYINAKLPVWKYSGSLKTISQYCIMALNVVKETNDGEDIHALRKLVLFKAEEICMLNQIVVDADLVRVLGAIVDALLEKK